mgnify:CR=1 FL=1
MVYRTLGTSWSVYLTPAGTTLRPLEVKAQCQWTVTCTIYLGLPLQHCVMHICEVNVSRNHLAAAGSNVLHAGETTVLQWCIEHWLLPQWCVHLIPARTPLRPLRSKHSVSRVLSVHNT